MPTTWECRLCAQTGEDLLLLSRHLEESHGVGGELATRLHAAKDYQDRSENTLGVYASPETLLAVFLRVTEREADDPMRFEE